MRGKEKCKALKEIRRQIAENNDIPYVVSQCTHQGDCKGTCPRCEAELRYLERELAIRQGLGKAVAVVGISTSVCAGLTACSPVELVKDNLGIGAEDLAGMTSLAVPDDIAGDVDIWPESAQDGTEETEPLCSIPEESTESREIEDNAAGAIPLPEETDEMVMGEILPYEEPTEETSAIEGDIAMPEDWMDSTWSYEQIEGQNP